MPPLPPACANCMTTLQLAQPGALPTQSSSQMLRAPDGQMRVDMGATSIITSPASQQALILDHAKQLARTVPLPQAPGMPALPGMPQLPGALPSGMPQPSRVEDLGKGLIEGHEVDGKRYTFQPPALPGMPSLPGMPKPSIPGMPAAPQAPQMPQAPQVPTVAEVWTSAQTKMPVLTKVTGPFGQQVTHCKPGPTPPPPNPAQFQVPPGYKLI